MVRIGIHLRSGSFTDRWMEYCELNGISYKAVDCYRSDIIDQLADCDGLMWHWSHYDPKAVLFARQLTYSLESMGKKVFPDSNSSWHFDDKVGQKYLLEAIKAPFVKSYVFYNRQEALQWVESTSFPKVFKLRCGAGASNVKLVNTRSEARRLVKRAFGSGFSPVDRMAFFKDRLWHLRRDKDLSACIGVIKGFVRLFVRTPFEISHGREKGYVYFQDFVANNDSDVRVIVIGERAVAIKRMVRDGDFRASGSGNIIYDPESINLKCIEIAFAVSKKLKAQCLAYDFVLDGALPLIVEMSYGFSMSAYDKCPGYWDAGLTWHQTPICLPAIMLDNFKI